MSDPTESGVGGSSEVSSRRKRMGSTIIINSEQLLQYQKAASLKEQEQQAKKIERKRQFAILTREKASLVQERLIRRQFAASVIQLAWKRKLAETNRVKDRKYMASIKILRCFKSYAQRRRLLVRNLASRKVVSFCIRYMARKTAARYKKFRQNLKWTHRQSELMFALLLGWRARKLMKLQIILSFKSSLSDINLMLSDAVLLAKKRLLEDGGQLLLESVSSLLTVDDMILFLVKVFIHLFIFICAIYLSITFIISFVNEYRTMTPRKKSFQ
jgi:hypothetical protein